MTTRFTLNAEYPVEQAELFRLLTDLDFVKGRMLDESGCVSVTPEEIQRDESKIIFKMKRECYARTLTGQDRSKTDLEVVLFEFDAKNYSGNWRIVDHPQQPRFDLRCSMRVEATPSGSREVRDHEVTVKVPMMGGKIEKKVKAGFDRAWPKRVAWLKKQLT